MRVLSRNEMIRLASTGACILMLAIVSIVAAAPTCCDDDCSSEESACVEQCGPCVIALEPAIPAADSITPCGLDHATTLQPSASNVTGDDILHVPKRLA